MTCAIHSSGGGRRGWAGLGAALVLVSVLLSPQRTRAHQVSGQPGPLVQGLLTDAGSGIPLATGSVALYGADGEEILSVVTDDDGRYSLPAPGPGEYRLKAERIGYHPQEKGPFTLRAGQTLTVDFQLSPSPLLLDSILVSVRRRSQALRAGEQLVYGRLLDDETAEPIPGGLLRLLTETGSSAAATLSDDDGLFWLVSPTAGTYRLQGERIGYKTATGPELHLMLGDSIGVEFYLSMEAILLNPLVVRATARPIVSRYDLTGMGGFFRRYGRFAKSGFGEFLTRDSLEKYGEWTQSTGHVMVLTMGSVWESDALSEAVTLRSACSPTYFLDGFPLPQGYPLWSLTPSSLEAVEVYVRPTIPAEFLRGRWPCGVVAYWTRRGGYPGQHAPLWRKLLLGAGVVGLGLVFIL